MLGGRDGRDSRDGRRGNRDDGRGGGDDGNDVMRICKGREPPMESPKIDADNTMR